MLCTYCNAPRLENEAPCQNCGAPSPLVRRPDFNGSPSVPQWGASAPSWGGAGNQNAAAFSNNQVPFPGQAKYWDGGHGTNGQGQGQTDFPIQHSWVDDPTMNFQNGSGQAGGNPQNGWAGGSSANIQNSFAQAPLNDNAAWGQMPGNQNEAPVQGGAMLPVPYQGDPNGQQLMVMPQDQDIQINNGFNGSMLPALPDEENGPIYVPPMYTKPRPIIPRYRAISGFLSVVIMTLLLCGGGGYYAKATGKLDFVGKMLGTTRPANTIPAQGVTVTDPPTKVETGPAKDIINSASTASSITTANTVAIPGQNFKPGDKVFVAYTVRAPKGKGNVIIKWYTNDQLYYITPPKEVANDGTYNGANYATFPQPLNGKVEIYWNDQLAERLFFAVRN